MIIEINGLKATSVKLDEILRGSNPTDKIKLTISDGDKNKIIEILLREKTERSFSPIFMAKPTQDQIKTLKGWLPN